MNIVVLTAALSSLNSGLYCTGRILRSMSMGGSAPKFMAKMSRQHVPYAGILATLVVYVVGVFLNYLVPSRVFEIVLNFARSALSRRGRLSWCARCVYARR